ncbi:MAG: flagellar assembly protein T N-terminal domain-containing protein [Nitrospirota bacterium]|nr:MAG: flagellar assembly protein T N-terminal domain-containing protein [Nitrospirota bacterium]
MEFKRVFIIMFLFVLIPVMVLQAEAKKSEIKTVMASGSAVIYSADVGAAKKEALEDAKRNAVDQVGSHVLSESVVENYDLVRDRIISKADGYVHRYEIISEKQSGNNYLIDIEADVSKSSLIDDATLIYHEMDKPRLMVIVLEVRGKDVIPTKHAEHAVSSIFVEKEFSLIDQAMAIENIRKDELRKIAEGDELAAAKIGLRSGAEVVVVGTASIGDVESIRGQLYASKASISLRALKTDNASLYAISSQSKAATDAVADSAQRKALERTSKSAASDIFWKIVKKWNKEKIRGNEIEIVLSGVNFTVLRSVKDEIGALRGVSEVFQRSFDAPTAVLNITYNGDSIRLAEILDEMKFKGFDLEVQGVSPGKLNLKVK